MAVDFSNVRVGDLVKLTRGDDEFSQIRVADVHTHPIHWVQDEWSSSHYAHEWDTLEIVKPPLPTKNGSIIRSEASGITYHLLSGRWVSSINRRLIATSVIMEIPHQVVYEPED